MKQFFSFIRKEFRHITRDMYTLVIMLLLPIILLVILGFAVSTEVKNTPFVVLDQSKTSESKQLIEKANGNTYFNLVANLRTFEEIEKSFQTGKSKIAVVIPSIFSDDLRHSGSADLQLIVDSSDPNEASTLVNYFQILVLQYQQDQSKIDNIPQLINVEVKMLYNPQLSSAYNFVPGLIGLIMMIICAMMTSVSIVKEKELGTMEILLVSPLKPTTIILAKAVPYLIVAIINVASILLMSYLILDVPVNGSLFLIFLLSFMFTLSALALGLLISTITETQQAAMIISAVGLMLPTMLLSGLIFPIEGMPLLLRGFSHIIPARWFIVALKDVMIKGLGFTAIWKEFFILFGMTVFLLAVSIKKFKNRL